MSLETSHDASYLFYTFIVVNKSCLLIFCKALFNVLLLQNLNGLMERDKVALVGTD
jgi:hypothetical protein